MENNTKSEASFLAKELAKSKTSEMKYKSNLEEVKVTLRKERKKASSKSI